VPAVPPVPAVPTVPAVPRRRSRTVALVLAGGRSSRFGADKLAAELDGRPLLHHALLAAGAVTDLVLLAVGEGSPAPALPSLGVPLEVVRDRSAGLGPLAGVDAALDHLALSHASADRLLVVPGDAPALRPALLTGLLCALDGHDAAVLADGDDWRPLPCAIRPAAAHAPVRDGLAGPKRSVRAVLHALGPAIVDDATWRTWDPDGDWRRDVDEPADLAQAAARAQQEAT